MWKSLLFDRNLLALSPRNPALCERLSAAETTRGRYRFSEDKKGSPIPAWVDRNGAAHILHSVIAPEREAEKYAAALENEGYLILLGLGGGFLAEAALRRRRTERLLVIDYDIDSIAELFCAKEYLSLLTDERFTLLVDPGAAAIADFISGTYYPCVHGGIRLLPLRPRCDFDEEHFLPAAAAVRSAIDRVSTDYSVQAHFGKRWFCNIIRNVRAAENARGVFPPITRAAVCAAGPSLDAQLDALAEKQRGGFTVIAADTALGTLCGAGIVPDAVVSIDCQHISYLHFVGNERVPWTLFLDIASPPLLAALAPRHFFFSGGHPLARYVSARFKELCALDTSGANVTYAAVSLAEKLGARTIELYGADFAYPQGMAYTRGAYFYPYLRRRQTRLAPASSELSAFLYKSPSLVKRETEASYYYETRSLEMYRRKLEEKARSSAVEIRRVEGFGAPLRLEAGGGESAARQCGNTLSLFSSGPARCGARAFLAGYKAKIEALALPETNIERYVEGLSEEERQVFTTLLPSAAAIRLREKIDESRALLSRVKSFCAEEITRVLDAESDGGAGERSAAGWTLTPGSS